MTARKPIVPGDRVRHPDGRVGYVLAEANGGDLIDDAVTFVVEGTTTTEIVSAAGLVHVRSKA